MKILTCTPPGLMSLFDLLTPCVCSISRVCSWQSGTRSPHLPFIVLISVSTPTMFPPTDSYSPSSFSLPPPVAVSSGSPLRRWRANPSRENSILEHFIFPSCVGQRDFTSCLYSRIHRAYLGACFHISTFESQPPCLSVPFARRGLKIDYSYHRTILSNPTNTARLAAANYSCMKGHPLQNHTPGQLSQCDLVNLDN